MDVATVIVSDCCLSVGRNEWPSMLMRVDGVQCEVRLPALTVQPVTEVMD